MRPLFIVRGNSESLLILGGVVWRRHGNFVINLGGECGPRHSNVIRDASSMIAGRVVFLHR